MCLFFKNNIFFSLKKCHRFKYYKVWNCIKWKIFLFYFFHIKRPRESCWCQIRGVIVKQETKQYFRLFRFVSFRFVSCFTITRSELHVQCTCRLKMHLFYYLFLRHMKVWKCDEDCFFIDAAFYIQNSKKTL